MKILSLGMPRTGSASLAEAYAILGYKGIYHSLYVMDEYKDWEIISRAADATFPALPTFTNKPFPPRDWDQLYDKYDVTTDMGAFFPRQLIDAYPEAKVVLVERDYDTWYKSVNDGIFKWFDYWVVRFYISTVEPLLGMNAAGAGLKALLGYFEAQDISEVRQNARKTYKRHYDTVPKMLPAERILQFRLEDGWEPLCKFLGKPVPDVPFPHVNEAAALHAKFRAKLRKDISLAAWVTVKWVVVPAAAAAVLFSRYKAPSAAA